jgi:hypothetical protein
LKEGSIASLWRINLSATRELHSGVNRSVNWECISTSGKEVGKISHHTCAMISAKDVCFFGGIKGGVTNPEISALNLTNNIWTTIKLNTKIEHIGRDDHACADMQDGTFLTFGGYVNGSRSNEVIMFKHEGNSFNCEVVHGGENDESEGPVARAGTAMCVSHDKQLYMFGGQEDDNRKLCDIWSFNCEIKKWTSLDLDDEAFCPTQRSGHSTCVWNNKMYIFGGILELTHEMNDLVCFDFDTKKFSCGSETADDLNATNKYQGDEGSPTLKNHSQSLKRGKTMALSMTPSKSPSKKHHTMQ